MTISVDRRRVLDYRIAAHGLHRGARDPADLDVLDLGVQETNVGSARLALAARLPAGYVDPLADPALTLLWSLRGAPHLHRTADLPALATALWPLSDADAVARLAAERAALKAAGIGGLEAFTAVAEALREAVDGRPTTKGEASHGVTTRLSAAYSYDCRSCTATHVYGGLFQLVGLPAGVRLDPGAATTTLLPVADRPPIPGAAAGTDALLRAYLRLHGPSTPAVAAGYLGSKKTSVRPAWPDDLVEVSVDGQQTWIAQDRADALLDAEPAAGVTRLLPPYDPFLQARDRDLLVPDEAHRKQLWRILANPGAVLADGELRGTWRAKVGAKGRVDVTVTPFAPLAARTRTAIDAEAERVASVRGAADVRVILED